MAHALMRTASMAIGKKAPSGSKGNNKQVHRVVANTGGGRRHTMLPQNIQPRDSVLSNGSSDRSSSVSDEALLASPAMHMPGSYGNGLFGYNFEEQLQEAWPIKCCFVVKEIMQTEIAYVQALADIIKGYLTPLYSHLLSSGESPNFIKTVFSNIVKIHQSHQELLEVFQESFVSPHEFGSSFLNMDFLTLYSVYCTSFSQGNECLEKSLHENQHLGEFITMCQHGLGHSLPLSSQLIKPVQRILKYRLLLEELNKNFDQQHPACSTIQKALEKMSSVAEQINTSFSNQKSKSKVVPSAVAKRRTNQLRDLQNSRGSKGRRERMGDNTSPMHRGLSKRSISETHLHFPSGPWGAKPSGPWGAKPEPMDNMPQQREKTLPNVKSLKSYFEKLNQEGEEEETRRGSGAAYTATGMKKAKSMSGTRKDSISSVGLDRSPVWSPTWSPTKSPIKMPVLPHTPSPQSSPTKSPATSPHIQPSPQSPPTKFPAISPHKSPTRNHPSLPSPKNPSPKHPSLPSPKNPSLSSFKNPSLSSSKNPSLPSPKNPSLSSPKHPSLPSPKNPSLSSPKHPSLSSSKNPSPKHPSLPSPKNPSLSSSKNPSPKHPSLSSPKMSSPKHPSLPSPKNPSLSSSKNPSPKHPSLSSPKMSSPKHPSLPSPKNPSLSSSKNPSPKHPSLSSPKMSSPKHPSLPSPKNPSLSSQLKAACPRPKNSWGSASDLRNTTESSYGGVSVGRSAKVMETEIDAPTTTPVSSSRSKAVSKISTEIMRRIAQQASAQQASAQQASAQPNTLPRTMV